jgi:hypothetical protein
MALLAAWGVVEQRARSAPDLGGRVPLEAPAWTAVDYAEMCRETRACVRRHSELRWYRVESDTLPTVVCRKGREVLGCYEGGAITLAGRHVYDSVLIRHELQHAALERVDASTHLCPWFDWKRSTLYLGQQCGR